MGVEERDEELAALSGGSEVGAEPWVKGSLGILILFLGCRGAGEFAGRWPGLGLIGNPGLKRGAEMLLRWTVIEEMDPSDPIGLSNVDGYKPSCGDEGAALDMMFAIDGSCCINMVGDAMGVVPPLLLFAFLVDLLRASSSRTAISSLTRSSSSLVLRLPRSKMSGLTAGPLTATTGDCRLTACCSWVGERLDCVRFNRAGTVFRLAMDWRGGLGKLPESITGVGFVMASFGAAEGRVGGGVRGGGEENDPTIEEAVRVLCSTLRGWVSFWIGEESTRWVGSVSGVCDRSSEWLARGLGEVTGDASMLV